MKLPSFDVQALIKTAVDAIKTSVDNTKTKVDAIKTAVDAGTIGKKPRRQLFLTNGTWTAPAGVTKVFVTGGGGGGGGSAIYTTGTLSDGASGGITSFGTLLSLVGGGGGKGVSNTNMEIAPGDSGGFGGQPGGLIFGNTFLIQGGNSGIHSGVQSILSSNNSSVTLKKSDYCSGGGGITYSASLVAGGGGGAMYVQGRELSVVPGTSYEIVIGNGGLGGTVTLGSSGDIKKASDGGDGYLIIEWWE